MPCGGLHSTDYSAQRPGGRVRGGSGGAAWPRQWSQTEAMTDAMQPHQTEAMTGAMRWALPKGAAAERAGRIKPKR